MVNRVILIGNLGKDPEVRRLDNGAVVAKFTLATNESYRDKEGEWQTQTEWHDIIAWRQLAERAENSLKKGVTVYVEGKLTHRTWQDQEGNPRRTTEVVANYFRILGKRDDGPAPAPPAPSVEGDDAPPHGPDDANQNEPQGDDLPF
jgi:single-strand DNA-binding protein